MGKIKFLIYFSLFFAILYLGPVPIGPITFSQFWKIFLLIYLIVFVFQHTKKRTPTFIKFSYARAVKNLFNGGTLTTPLLGIIGFVRYMMFPLIFQFISIKIKEASKLNKIIIILAQFVILSGIPFLMEVLEPLGNEIDITQNLDSYVGVFQGAHAASTTLAISILILIPYVYKTKLSLPLKSFNIILIFLGIYLLYFTFARTGWAMFVVGLIILFLPNKITLKQILIWVVILCVISFGFIYLLEHIEAFYNRIFDIRNGQQTALGSGRLVFWQGAFDLWWNGNFFELLFGHGMGGLHDKMYQLVGAPLTAHNEFFTHLAVNGLIGIFIFVAFLINLFKFIRKRRQMPTYKLALATFILYISLMMTQGGMWFPVDVFMVLIFVKLEIEYKQHNNHQLSFSNMSNG